MAIENLLSKLHKVQKRGSNSWMARCSVHNDKTPSLSIKDDNGTILIHCFGCGAGAAEIAGSLGIDLSDLFPPSDNYNPETKQKRNLFYPGDVLSALEFESLVLVMIAKDMIDKGTVDQDTRDRLWQAHLRISGALEYTRRPS